MNLHKIIEICLKDDNMHIFVMINSLICINNYVITCMNSMLSMVLWETNFRYIFSIHSYFVTSRTLSIFGVVNKIYIEELYIMKIIRLSYILWRNLFQDI